MAMWKRLLVIGFSAGAGFAIVMSLTLVGWNWYQSRPRPPSPPKPWDTKAITTEFSHAHWFSDVSFFYLATNNTQMDYKLAAGHNMKLVLRTTASARSLPHIDAQTLPDNLTISLPIFVPARETVRLRISLETGYPKPAGLEAEAGTEKTTEYIKKELQGLAGFVLFDEEKRYRIEFPDGWSEQGE